MEISINMSVFKTILLVIVFMAISAQADPLLYLRSGAESTSNHPIAESSNQDLDKKKPEEDFYDQRQNGTENYRVKVDGLVFIMAPADTLLLASAALDPSSSALLIPELNPNRPKPKPEKEETAKLKPEKESLQKSAQQEPVHAGQKPALRISNLLAPFLNRIRRVQHQSN